MSSSARESESSLRGVPIFIDGEKFTVSDDEMTASQLLALGGKNSAEWYLVLKHGREQTEYRDDAVIELKPGSKFLSVFTGPTSVS
jgi:hypothetical protein